MVVEEESASAAAVVTPRRLHTSPVHPSGPHRGLVSTAAASCRQRRASHHTTHRWHFGSSGLVLLIAPLRAVTSLQLKRPTVASMHLEHSTIEKTVSPETGIIPEIVSKTAAQTPRASMSLPDARPIGTAIGTGITIIGGMGTVAASSTAPGSSTTLDSIPTDTPMMSTRMIIIRPGTTRAFTRAMQITTVRAPTILPINPPTRPLLPPRSN